MSGRAFLSISEQVAARIRSDLKNGKWSGNLPGIRQLAKELEVHVKTVETALHELEREGILISQGERRSRRIVLPSGDQARKKMSINIMLYETADTRPEDMINIRNRLDEAGHIVNFTRSTLSDLRFDPRRVEKFVNKHPADAWLVASGSRDILEWFACQPTPVFALYGRRTQVSIAATGPAKIPPMIKGVRRLIELGHRRIVHITREDRRKPHPGRLELSFLEELETHGISVGPYNLPDWKNDMNGFQMCLQGLFSHTPPTALVLSESMLLFAAQQYIAKIGLKVPEHVSLITLDYNPVFSWGSPSISHINWDSSSIASKVALWAKRVTRREVDRKQTLIHTEFIEGGSIGPAPRP